MIGVEVHDHPFPHVELQGWLGAGAAEATLEWLEDRAPWHLRETSFYEQYEFSLLSSPPPDRLGHLTAPATISRVGSLMERTFGVSPRELVDVTAHRLLPGQTIRLHNDFIGGEESHRLLVQLNRGWTVENGGLLMLFSSTRAEDLEAAIVPLHDTAFAFEISPRSHHAVSTVAKGERFTLVYTFREGRG